MDSKILGTRALSVGRSAFSREGTDMRPARVGCCFSRGRVRRWRASRYQPLHVGTADPAVGRRNIPAGVIPARSRGDSMPSRTARRRCSKHLARIAVQPIDRRALEAARILASWRAEARHRARSLGAPPSGAGPIPRNPAGGLASGPRRRAAGRPGPRAAPRPSPRSPAGTWSAAAGPWRIARGASGRASEDFPGSPFTDDHPRSGRTVVAPMSFGPGIVDPFPDGSRP